MYSLHVIPLKKKRGSTSSLDFISSMKYCSLNIVLNDSFKVQKRFFAVHLTCQFEDYAYILKKDTRPNLR